MTASGPRPTAKPLSLVCACVDEGINTPACFSSVTRYCQDTAAKPDMKVCAAMSGFINKQDFPSGMVVARFLIDTCKVTLPVGPSACACLEGADTLPCRTAALNACLLGNSLCPATVFGPEAIADSQESFNNYVDRECAAGSKLTTRVDMNFTGIGKDEFQLNYAKGTAAAIAAIVGLPVSEVTASRIREVHFKIAKGGRRRLAQDDDEGPYEKVLLTTYNIRSAPRDAHRILERLQDAAADNNAGLYAALKANGVPLRPTLRVQGVNAGQGAGGLSVAAIVGIAIGAGAGGLLLLAGLIYTILKCRKSKPNPHYAGEPSKPAAAGKAAGGAAQEAADTLAARGPSNGA